MPKNHVLMIQERFAAKVQDGTKPCTIRGQRKRTITVGDTLDLRSWTGLPYRSKQKKLRVVTVWRVRNVAVLDTCVVCLEGNDLSGTGAFILAMRDGFENLIDFFKFFDDAHGLPFFGHLIEWKP